MNVIDRICNLQPYTPSDRNHDSKDWSYCDWNESQFPPTPLVASSIEGFLLSNSIEK